MATYFPSPTIPNPYDIGGMGPWTPGDIAPGGRDDMGSLEELLVALERNKFRPPYQTQPIGGKPLPPKPYQPQPVGGVRKPPSTFSDLFPYTPQPVGETQPLKSPVPKEPLFQTQDYQPQFRQPNLTRAKTQDIQGRASKIGGNYQQYLKGMINRPKMF